MLKNSALLTLAIAGYTYGLQITHPNPVGKCVKSTALGTVPADIYGNTGIEQGNQNDLFSKSLTVRGIKLLGNN